MNKDANDKTNFDSKLSLNHTKNTKVNSIDINRHKIVSKITVNGFNHINSSKVIDKKVNILTI